MTDSPTMTLRFSLPWAPSANAYWFHTVMGGKFKKAQARVLLSDRGREYRIVVLDSLNRQRVPRGALKGRLAVRIVAYPPDRRARDLDNLLKGLLDALVSAQTIPDDSNIDDLQIVRGPVVPQGVMELTLTELGEYNDQASLDLAPLPAPSVFAGKTPF